MDSKQKKNLNTNNNSTIMEKVVVFSPEKIVQPPLEMLVQFLIKIHSKILVLNKAILYYLLEILFLVLYLSKIKILLVISLIITEGNIYLYIRTFISGNLVLKSAKSWSIKILVIWLNYKRIHQLKDLLLNISRVPLRSMYIYT